MYRYIFSVAAPEHAYLERELYMDDQEEGMAMSDDDWSPSQKALMGEFRHSRTLKEAPKNWLQRIPKGRVVLVAVLVAVLAVLVTLGFAYGPGAVDRLQVASTSKDFCTAISDTGFSRAYSMLSKDVRARYSSTQVANIFEQAHVGACVTAQGLAEFAVSHGHAEMGITFVATDDSDYLTRNWYRGEMTLVREDGGWKVDGFYALTGNLLT